MGTEMLLASLKELRRFDVIDVINDSEGKLIKLSRLEKAYICKTRVLKQTSQKHCFVFQIMSVRLIKMG